MDKNVRNDWDVPNVYGDLNRQVNIGFGSLNERPIELAIRSRQTTVQPMYCTLMPREAEEIGVALIQAAGRTRREEIQRRS